MEIAFLMGIDFTSSSRRFDTWLDGITLAVGLEEEGPCMLSPDFMIPI